MFDSIPSVLPPGMYMVPCVLFQLLPDEIFSVLAMMPSERGNPMESFAVCGLQVRNSCCTCCTCSTIPRCVQTGEANQGGFRQHQDSGLMYNRNSAGFSANTNTARSCFVGMARRKAHSVQLCTCKSLSILEFIRMWLLPRVQFLVMLLTACRGALSSARGPQVE